MKGSACTPFHGLPCDGGAALYDYPMFKPKRSVLQYLQDYFEMHQLEEFARFNERVTQVTSLGQGSWQLDSESELGRRRYHSRFVAVCTSKLRRPFEPEIQGRETFQGRVLHSREYRSGRAFVGQDVGARLSTPRMSWWRDPEIRRPR
mmetsp:Transcript_163586/g.519740  ORF Transcript_163586/g.519740 Transcript_163586/m.519740 type:complete len:148 (+) Transcript_163586:291-734(+)